MIKRPYSLTIMTHVENVSELMGSRTANRWQTPTSVLCHSDGTKATHGTYESNSNCATIKVNTTVRKEK